jgi:hypothetical protein
MIILLAAASSGALGLICGTFLSVFWLLAFWPIVFGSLFVLARFEGFSVGSSAGWAVAAIVILQAAYLLGGYLRPRRDVSSANGEPDSSESPHCSHAASKARPSVK